MVKIVKKLGYFCWNCGCLLEMIQDERNTEPKKTKRKYVLSGKYSNGSKTRWHKRWDKAEDGQLLTMVRDGRGLKEISHVLNRNMCGIRCRLNRINK